MVVSLFIAVGSGAAGISQQHHSPVPGQVVAFGRRYFGRVMISVSTSENVSHAPDIVE